MSDVPADGVKVRRRDIGKKKNPSTSTKPTNEACRSFENSRTPLAPLAPEGPTDTPVLPSAPLACQAIALHRPHDKG